MGCGDWVVGHFEDEKNRTWGGPVDASACFFFTWENHLKEPYDWSRAMRRSGCGRDVGTSKISSLVDPKHKSAF